MNIIDFAKAGNKCHTCFNNMNSQGSCLMNNIQYGRFVRSCGDYRSENIEASSKSFLVPVKTPIDNGRQIGGCRFKIKNYKETNNYVGY